MNRPPSPENIENEIVDDRVRTQRVDKHKERIIWTKDMNVSVIRCYYTTIKNTPNTYRKRMHDLWKIAYPETTVDQQRICDQRRLNFEKAENAQNQTLRGQWLTFLEIQQIETDKNSKLTPFEKRKSFCKPNKKKEKILEQNVDLVNELIDVKHIQCNDITDINHLAYVCALTSIKNAGLKHECIKRDKQQKIKKQIWITNMKRRILALRKDINKIDQMNAEILSRKNVEKLARHDTETFYT